jgi:hypothetical protein
MPSTGQPKAIPNVWPAALTRDRPRSPQPPFGTAEWMALPEDDPRRMRAVWHAAWCWHYWWQPEMIGMRRMQADRDMCDRLRAASADVSSAGGWAKLAQRASHAELVRRRGGPYLCAGCRRPFLLPAGTVVDGDYDCGRCTSHANTANNPQVA